MVAAFASALSARDPALAGHAARVTDLAARLAAWLEWDDASLYAVYVGGPLHDIGKVAVSEAILRKRPITLTRPFGSSQTMPRRATTMPRR